MARDGSKWPIRKKLSDYCKLQKQPIVNFYSSQWGSVPVKDCTKLDIRANMRESL